METARTSETSVDNYFTRQYIPEDNSEGQYWTFGFLNANNFKFFNKASHRGVGNTWLYIVTSTEQSPPYDINSHSAEQELPRLLWTAVQYTTTLPSTPTLPTDLLLQGLQTDICTHLSYQTHATCLAHLILLDHPNNIYCTYAISGSQGDEYDDTVLGYGGKQSDINWRALMMEAVSTSETSTSFYQTAQRNPL
jgi:hypothetical protein